MLRLIPKMDDLLQDPDILRLKRELSGKVVLAVLREEAENLRVLINKGEFIKADKAAAFEHVKRGAIQRLNKKKDDRLKRVINATGIVIHTNLGRAPLSAAVMEQVGEIASSYSNLEYNHNEGTRRNRMFYLEELIRDITGAEAAIAVNNNAAAIFLALRTLCKDKEVVLSRGEIVEIGDSFRISEIIRESGCILREAGTTNKTNSGDYESLINENTSAFLKVHRSNFKIIGFTGEVSSQELAELSGRYARGMAPIIVIEDMGSGILMDLSRYGFRNARTVEQALSEGVDVVTFSGDKILGGPQAGIIAGKKRYLDLMRKNQMYRCLRIDKLCLTALEAVLRQYRAGDFMDIPVIKSLLEPKEEIFDKANQLKAMLEGIPQINAYVGPHESMTGGGALPGETVVSYAVFITVKGKSANELDHHFRNQPIPVIATVQNEQVALDMRMVEREDFNYIRDILADLF